LKRLNARDYLEALGVDGRIILKWNLRIQWEGVDWIHLAQNRGLWRDCYEAVD
jgi:hypothetical protein